jgi:hypothetical protein
VPSRRPAIDRAPCRAIPRHVYRRPDPLIYSQKYLLGQGLSVTWDNPDIHLELDGIPVSSAALAPDTKYEVVARIWNGSFDAPAIDLPVRFSYLDFGIGGTSVPIGETRVDLPVNAAPGCPAFAKLGWRTPSTPGHYCIQVDLIWPDDANPFNNLGQENTNVVALNSPHGSATFPVRNSTHREQRLRLEVDAYAIPARRPCGDELAAAATMSAKEKEEHRRAALAAHGLGSHPLPQGWHVTAIPTEFALAPHGLQNVTVEIDAADGFAGRQLLNVHAFDGQTPVGGVTLLVEGAA